ncbi:MAG: phosphotransferase [Acidobacteriota bacterium]
MGADTVAPIQQRVMEFVRSYFQPGYNHFNVVKLVGDASSRQYYRYFQDDGTSWILAAYPEPFDAACFPFLEIHRLLDRIGVPVPRIYRVAGELGVVLQEDLGDESLQRRLRNTSAAEALGWFRQAVDHIVRMQTAGTRSFSPECAGYHVAFDEAKLTWEFDFFRKYFLNAYRGCGDWADPDLVAECARISRELAGYPRVFCHRDFHVRNLMVKDERLFVIDFQDARWGPPTYDLVSLLKDSLELHASLQQELTGYYLERIGEEQFAGLPAELFSPGPFERQFHLMAIQRLLKALGTYGYQIQVRGNFIYEQYIPGSLHRALESLVWTGEFPVLQRVVGRELRALSPDRTSVFSQ